MADDALRLAKQLVLTPQLQLAIRLLSTPRRELPQLIAEVRGIALEACDPDPLCQPFTRDEDDVGPPWTFATLPAEITADVWLEGNPPRAFANRGALPAVRVAEPTRDAQWLVRSLVQRARTYERVVGAIARLRPQLGIAQTADGIAPVPTRELADATELHESTIERVARACTVQNRHRELGLAVSKRGICVTT